MLSVNNRTLNITLVGIFVALLALCSYIHIPFVGVSFTLQTFSLYLCLFCIGEKRALATVFVYILMGIIGLPVFSGFTGGIGALFGLSGGFIIGFPFSLIVCARLTKIFGTSLKGNFISALCSLPVCHIAGILWFCFVYFGKITPAGILSSFTLSSLPFILPDALKLLAAALLGVRINKILRSI